EKLKCELEKVTRKTKIIRLETEIIQLETEIIRRETEIIIQTEEIKRRQIREAGEKERKQLELEFASSIKRSHYIEHYSNQFSSYPKLNEEEIQKGFDQLIVNLLNTSNNSTSLKYLNTSSSYYLENKFNPNCTFIYKNINIDMDQEEPCLQDFVVCLGNLISPHV
ncbi:unnamed protein product, partial [Rotaria magnacalcarata]